ncbi:MAG: ThiF family adenylyltransferase, partial [Pseudomonadales bacterium]|nr:ThiF family adenylyltransferase [Pseudomonadales bacterium]
LFADLRQRFSTWLSERQPPAWRINARFAVILETPIIAPDGAPQDGTDLRAFVTDQSVGDIAVALGVALAAEPGEGSKVGFVKPLMHQQADTDAVRAVAAQSAEVHYEFDRKLATQISGRHTEDGRQVVMVGAGAIGSQVADCLVREGRFRWTIVDDDRLLPHNLARHIARKGDVTKEKASFVASSLSATLEDTERVACAKVANVMTHGPARAEIDQALEQADLIVDATASVLAERYLSDHSAAARRASIFFNPSGDAAVLLAESADRSPTLRELEAQYLSLVARDSALAGHLAPTAGTYAYTGACRAITNLIPQSRIMALCGLVANGLAKAADQDNAAIRIWSLREPGAVEIHAPAVTPADSFEALEWTISVDQGLTGRILAMRAAHLPKETGGVLTGIVDIPAKRIQLVDAAPAPPDSKSSTNGFERGTSGVQEYLERVFEQTRGQVRYVGEWHSHPPRAATLPSPTDLSQIDWLATLFDMDTLPALMVIAGDEHVSVIVANRQAERVEADSATAASHGKGAKT